MTSEIVIVAAVAANGVIGTRGALPWSLPADMRRFRQLTLGHPVVMGRRTFDSIGRPLAGRTNIVLSRDPLFAPAGCTLHADVDDALGKAAGCDGGERIYVIGGAAVYTQTLDRAQRLEITHVDGDVDGDTLFPEFDVAGWTVEVLDRHAPDDRHAFGFECRSYTRT